MEYAVADRTVRAESSAYTAVEDGIVPLEVSEFLADTNPYSDPVRVECEPKSGFAVAVRHRRAIAWSYAQKSRTGTTYEFDFAADVETDNSHHWSEVLPQVRLVVPWTSGSSLSLSREPGLLVVMSSGRVVFYDTISYALTGDAPVTGSLRLRRNEQVTCISETYKDPWHYVCGTSQGRLVEVVVEPGVRGGLSRLHLDDAGGGHGAGGIGSFLSGILGGGGTKPSTASAHLDPNDELSVQELDPRSFLAASFVPVVQATGGVSLGIAVTQRQISLWRVGTNVDLHRVKALDVFSGEEVIIGCAGTGILDDGETTSALIVTQFPRADNRLGYNIARVVFSPSGVFAVEKVRELRYTSLIKTNAVHMDVQQGVALVIFPHAIVLFDDAFEETFVSSVAINASNVHLGMSMPVFLSKSILTLRLRPEAWPELAADPLKHAIIRVEQGILVQNAPHPNPLIFSHRTNPSDVDISSALKTVTNDLLLGHHTLGVLSDAALETRTELADRAARIDALEAYIAQNEIPVDLSVDLSIARAFLAVSQALWLDYNQVLTYTGSAVGGPASSQFMHGNGALLQGLNSLAGSLAGSLADSPDPRVFFRQSPNLAFDLLIAISALDSQQAALTWDQCVTVGVGAAALAAETKSLTSEIGNAFSEFFLRIASRLGKRTLPQSSPGTLAHSPRVSQFITTYGPEAPIPADIEDEANAQIAASLRTVADVILLWDSDRSRVVISSLVSFGARDHALLLARKYKDFASLAELLVDHPDDLRLALVEFGPDFSDAYFSLLIADKRWRQLLEHDNQTAVTNYLLEAHPYMLWLSSLAPGQPQTSDSLQLTAESLDIAVTNTDSIPGAISIASLMKLAALAASPESRLATKADESLAVLAIQNELSSHVVDTLRHHPSVYSPASRLATQDVRRAPLLKMRHAFSLRVANFASLSFDQAIDFCSLADADAAMFVFAFRLLLASTSVPYDHVDAALRAIWRRLYLQDDWSRVRGFFSDSQTAEFIRGSLLYAVVSQLSFLPRTAFLKPLDSLACDASLDLAVRYSSLDATELGNVHAALDAEDETLKSFFAHTGADVLEDVLRLVAKA